MILVVPSIMRNVRGTKDKISSVGLDLLFSTVSVYMDNNLMNYPLLEDNVYCITVKDLLDGGQLASVNIIDGLEVTDIVQVQVTHGEYSYELNNSCNIYHEVVKSQIDAMGVRL